MTGITSEKIKSIGGLKTELKINNWYIPCEFQLVDENFPIATDGILGQDFLNFYNCIINYEKYTLTINFDYGNTSIDLSNHNIFNVVTIPSRSEILIELPVQLKEDSITVDEEISSGVFVAKCIMSIATPIVKIMNTNDTPVTINNLNIKYEPLSSYDIVSVYHTETVGKSKTIKNEFSKTQMDILENNPHITEPLRSEFCNLLNKYSDVFAQENVELSTNNFYKQKLRLSDETPVFVKNYRLPHSQKEEIRKQVDKLIENKIIEPSSSEFSSPILLVPKKGEKNKKWRLVVDFRKLNKKLIGDVFPIPRIDDILDQLGRAKFFSVLDLQSGFHQIELEENSRDYTSFQTEQGSYRFTRVPFGLKIAPNSFARMMSLAFSGLTPEKAFLYMDDLIVIGCSEKHHLNNLQSIFENCRKYNLKLNPKKCSFFKHEVTYLGHKCTTEGVTIDDSKINAIMRYPVPKNPDETKRFVAFANYYRKFIKDFASLTQPMNKLTRKNVKFQWNNDCQKSFEIIKNCLVNTPILAYPNFEKEFIIVTDASKVGVGGTLCQNYDGLLKPISYFSRSFTKGESNKATIEQELLGIYFSIMHFRPYIYLKKFKVLTDHKPLIYLFSLKNPSSRLTRIRLELEEFDFSVEHIPGKNNCISDALSRVTIEDLKSINIQNFQLYAITRSMTKNEKTKSKENIANNNEKSTLIFCDDEMSHIKVPKLISTIKNSKIKVQLVFHKTKKSTIVHEQNLTTDTAFELDRMLNELNKILNNKNIPAVKLYENDIILRLTEINIFKNKIKAILENKTIIIVRERKVLTKDEEIYDIIRKYHDHPLIGGHCGVKRTLSKLKNNYYFKGMAKRVKNYIKNCEKCKINKPGISNRENLVNTETPNSSFDIVQIDTIGPLNTTENGYNYVLSSQCELTKYIILTPMIDKSAYSVARAIYSDIILIYGPPKTIKTDQGTEFLNSLIKTLCDLMRINFRNSTPYHHETVGSIERNHRELNVFLRNYLDLEKNDWDNWLQVYAFAYNTTPSYYHDYSPFELIFGKKPNSIENFLVEKVSPVYNVDDYSKIIKYQLEISLKRAKYFIEEEKSKRKNFYDKNISRPVNVKIGDRVYIKKENRNKFEKFYNGPFEVVEIYKDNNIRIRVKDKETIVHKNNIIKK